MNRLGGGIKRRVPWQDSGAQSPMAPQAHYRGHPPATPVRQSAGAI